MRPCVALCHIVKVLHPAVPRHNATQHSAQIDSYSIPCVDQHDIMQCNTTQLKHAHCILSHMCRIVNTPEKYQGCYNKAWLSQLRFRSMWSIMSTIMYINKFQ